MKNFQIRAILSWEFLLLAGLATLMQAQTGTNNCSPQVSILWPRAGDSFRAGIFIKIKADAKDSDGSVAEVQFFSNTNLIGVVTNQPFNLVWQVILPGVNSGPLDLMAVAVDTL